MTPEQAVQTLKRAHHLGGETPFEQHMKTLQSLLGTELEAVERELPTHLGVSVYPLVETGTHLLAAGGKRIRPILTLLSAAIVDQSGENARKLAASGELVHLATLLHDDVIDDADLRRGAETPRVVWSNTASVLGGDYALTQALELVGSVGTTVPLLEAIQTLRALVEGEVLQLEHRGRATLDVEGYFEIVDRKTASLFRWCCRAGAHLGNDPAIVQALGQYGEALGICFQIVDDVLDFASETEVLGKQLLTDLKDGKLTLPVLIAMRERPELRAAIARSLAPAGEAPDPRIALPDDALEAIQDALESTRALDEARKIGLDHAHRARKALSALPESVHRDALETVALALASRMR